MPSAHRALLAVVGRTFRSKPLAFIVGAWIAGIWLADLSAAAPMWPGTVGLLLSLAALGSRRHWLALGLLLLGIAALGCAATRLALTPPPDNISTWSGKQVAAAGTIVDDPAQRCDRWHFVLDCNSVLWSGRSHSGRGSLSVSTSQDLSGYEVGDFIVVYGIPERPSAARNPGGFSAECWAARHGSFAVMTPRPAAIIRLRRSAWSWYRWAAWIRLWAGRLRHSIADANRRVMVDRQAATLVDSILFGANDQTDGQAWTATEERFKRAGVYHELVVSGAQIALLFGLLSLWRRQVLHARGFVRRWLWLRRTGGYSYRFALGGGLLLVALYVLLIGPQPSVQRAAVVAFLFFTARCLDREIDPENTLAAAALFILIFNPLTLYDLGFQFSFSAVWGILRGSPPLARAFGPAVPRDAESAGEIGVDRTGRSQPGWVAWIVSASLSAQLATAPLQAHHFQTLSLVGPFSNPPVEFLVTILLPLGLASSIFTAVVSWLHLLPMPVLWCLNWPTEALAWVINGMVSIFACPPPAAILVYPPGWSEAGAYWALLAAATLPCALRRRQTTWTLVGLAVAVFVVGQLRPAPGVDVPTLSFIDVGQGDACLVRLPGGATMLVDGGGSPRAPCERRDCSDAPVGHLAERVRSDCTDVGRDILASYLRHERVRQIDLMVITHPHDDHLWGLDAILDPKQRFDVRAVLDAGMPFDTRANEEWEWLLRRPGLNLIRARRGMQLTLGPARLELLHPSLPFLTHTRSDPNNNSIVIRLEVGGSRVLLTGDAEAEAEAAMGSEDVRCDVLKVGHHGSAYSSSDAWLDRVQPRIAVISCGRHNSFGHPSPATLERLRQHGVQTYRTDMDGAVTLELQPEGWRATTMLRH